MADATNIQWTDLAAWKLEGQGWTDVPHRYARIPARAQKSVTEAVWRAGLSSTGLHFYFESDATAIHARWTLSGEQLNEADFPSCGFSGLDLYADHGGEWRWAGAGIRIDSRKPSAVLIEGLPAKRRKYLLYLPLRNRPEKVELGVAQGFSLKNTPCKTAPVVYYGSSIVHGAYASHPGLVHPSWLGRFLKRPFVNLGFSGAAQMEPEMAQLLAELKPAAYVLDALPNMDEAMVRQRTETFVRLLRKARPKTPLILNEDAPLGSAWLKPQKMAEQEAKWKAQRAVFRKLVKEGMTGLFYLRGETFMGNDSETGSDGLHPNDLGYERMVRKLLPVLKKALGK